MEEESLPQTEGLTGGGFVPVPEPFHACAFTELSAAVGGGWMVLLIKLPACPDPQRGTHLAAPTSCP